ncbi:MAG: hypothetical protein NT109_09280 [Flavobacteriia bacterium]|nr:hypothetical protein [Flavobacteriia bacterium]
MQSQLDIEFHKVKINPKFKSLLKDPELKFTIILGSGFHQHFLGKDSILSSWKLLLQKLSPETKLSGEYHLDFEKIIEAKKIPCEDSSKTEERLINCVKELLQKEQECILSDFKDCYPTWLFNPKYVSDVISLNFDEIPELLLNRTEGVSLSEFKNDSSFKKESKTSYAYLSTRYKTVYFGKNETIRFWHPHGIISNKKSIVLGLHRYAHMVENSLRIRNHHMEAKRNNNQDNTWYYKLLDNPIIILGAGMSQSEWDLWFALTSRNRTNGEKLPLFQMRDCECKNDAQHQWFEPLFTGMKFDEQWKKLEKLFKK